MKRFYSKSSCLVLLMSSVVFIWASTTPPSGSLIEEHESSVSSSYLGKYQGHQLKQAQQFYLDDQDPQPISGIGILLKSTDYGSPSGDITIEIYDNGGGNVPGLLVAGTTKSFTPVLGQWNYISYLELKTSLNTGKSNKYWIVVTVTVQSGNDAYCWHRSSTNTYDRGYRKTFNMGGSNAWATQSGDFSFRIYGDPSSDVSSRKTGYGPPDECHLVANFPNPFNPTTTISYCISEDAAFHRISIGICNLLGKEIASLVDRIHAPGEYSVFWDGRDVHGMEVSSGIYFYKLISDGRTIEMNKMLKMK